MCFFSREGILIEYPDSVIRAYADDIAMVTEDIDKVWPSIEKTLALFDILQEIETDHPKTLDLNITGEHQLRPDQVTLNSPENIDELNTDSSLRHSLSIGARELGKRIMRDSEKQKIFGEIFC